MIYKIAFRNIARNRRRSTVAGMALVVSAIAMLLFGAFMMSLILGVKTSTISSDGHLTIFHTGYLDYGEGNPGRYSIADYKPLIATLKKDPILQPLLNEVMARVSVFGVAGNSSNDASKTFYGEGFVPSAYEHMKKWDEYRIRRRATDHPLAMDDHLPEQGVIGVGLARILGYCEALHLDHCTEVPAAEAKHSQPLSNAPQNRDLTSLTNLADDSGPTTQAARLPRIDLLGATVMGAPNVVSLNIGGTYALPLREIDNAYVGMPLALAQQLLYGRGPHQVTSIVLQLHHTDDLAIAKLRVQRLLKRQAPELEVRDFVELSPMYKQVIALFGSIFFFITVIMCVIVLFSVANAMGMSVMERTGEIGTLRAMGVQRSGIRRQFLAEGVVLGLVGATIGVMLSIGLAELVNRAEWTWLPPGQVYPVPLHLTLWVYPTLVVGTWIGLVAVAALASWLPANRAARMTVVDALRYT